MKRKFLILFTLLLILIAKVSYAEGVISAEISYEGREVSISGALPQTTQPMVVTLRVGDDDNIIYIEQKITSESGAFDFNFVMRENQPPGVYNIAIGTNADVATYYGKIYYNMAANNFLTADLDITLSAYVPTMTGTISCTEGKTTNFSIVNITDNTTICNEEITSDTGVFDVSYRLPSFVSNKEYQLVITCKENDTILAQIGATIDSSIFSVHVEGGIIVEDNIQMDTHVRTTNSNLINSQSTITENKTISSTIPNLLPNAAFKITAKGWELVPIEEQLPDPEEYLYKVIKSVDVSENDNVPYFIQVQSIQDLANKTVVVEYPQDMLRLVDACVFTSKKETAPVNLDNLGINITSISDGRIEFVVSDNFIQKYPKRIVISGLWFEAVSTGIADINCKIIQEGN